MKNKNVLFILWGITTIATAITFNFKGIQQESFSSLLMSAVSIAIFGFLIGILFSLKKKGEEHTKNIALVATIFNILMIIGTISKNIAGK